MEWQQVLEELAQPFPTEKVQWRAGATTRDKKRAQALAYVEARDYEDRLNELLQGDWSVTFKPWGDTRLICELTVMGVTRASTGEFEGDKKNAIAEGTVAEAQAFKRACVKFGLGRYLYDIPVQWIDYDSEKGRLMETPSLPARFTPQTKIDTTPRLSSERVEAMVRELEKLGYSSLSHEALVERVTGSKKTLSQLSEAEALSVWSHAKRQQASSPVEIVTDAEALEVLSVEAEPMITARQITALSIALKEAGFTAETKEQGREFAAFLAGVKELDSVKSLTMAEAKKALDSIGSDTNGKFRTDEQKLAEMLSAFDFHIGLEAD